MEKNFPNTIYVVGENFEGFIYDEDNVKREFKFFKYIDKGTDHEPYLCEHNKDYNRYKDIRPFRYNVIKINLNNDGNHYINASGINIFDKNYFIATQGPKEETIKDFWTMIDEKKCKMIVMLCQLQENNKSKCAEYWKEFAETKEEHVNDLIDQMTFREIYYKLPNSPKEMKPKKVTQIHFTEWKDKDVPDYKDGKIFNLFIEAFDCIDRKRKENDNPDNSENPDNSKNPVKISPVVVHCSAGVGRTGTFIAMYYLYKEIKGQIKENKNVIMFSIFNLVRKLKEMRPYLVQTDEQYLFLYKFVEYLLKEEKKRKENKIKEEE